MKCPNCKIELLGSMKRCPKCGYDIDKGKIDDDYLKQRQDQEEKALREKESREERIKRAEEERQKLLQQLEERYSKFPCTTGYNFEGYKITDYLGIKSGESVLGTGLLSDISAGITDFFGTQSFTVESKLGKAKNQALVAMIDSCYRVNANAVIGVDFDIMTYGPNMIVVCANGTAVKIKKTEQ